MDRKPISKRHSSRWMNNYCSVCQRGPLNGDGHHTVTSVHKNGRLFIEINIPNWHDRSGIGLFMEALGRRAARTDRNQTEIVKAFRQIGASVQILSACPDTLVGFRGVKGDTPSAAVEIGAEEQR